MELNLPWEQSAVIDPGTYLPVVDNTPFESLQASGCVLQAGVNIAYHLALLECGLTHPDILVPSILIIDSPAKRSAATPTTRNEADGSTAASRP